MSAVDLRRLRVVPVRPEILAGLLRDGHVCQAGASWLPTFPLPADFTVMCAQFNHREQLLELCVWSSTFEPVPQGVEPPTMPIAFTRGTPPAQVAP